MIIFEYKSAFKVLVYISLGISIKSVFGLIISVIEQLSVSTLISIL